MVAADRPSAKGAALAELAHCAQELGVALSSEQLAIFQAYIDIVLFWRTRVSLTSAATAEAVVRSHLVDSLAVATIIQPGWSVADLGSGAGFPGIPLAIVFPRSYIVLIESRRKKANFLRDAVRSCRLTNVDVCEGRAEAAPTQRLGTFDLVVSRAVWTVPDFLRVASGLLRPGGLGVAMKGPKGRMETTGHPAFLPEEIVGYQLYGGVGRTLLIYRKR